MVKPDVIITIPYGIESPYFRWWAEAHANMLGKVIIGYYNDHREHDFRAFIKQAMPDATHVDIGEVTDRDWRNQTVNACLKESHSEWVMFVEDDFIFTTKFLDRVLTEAENYDVVGYGDMGEWSQDIRLHPAFILVKRTFIDKTRKDFGAYPDRNRDHFAVFTEDLFNLKARQLDIAQIDGWRHLKGTYSNYMLVLEGKEPNYEPERFRDYVRMTLKLDVEWDERFKEWSHACIR